MIRILFFLSGFLSSTLAFSQDDEMTSKEFKKLDKEIAVDGYFSATNLGGNFGVGLKLGLKLEDNDKFVFGPSVRLMRSWSNEFSEVFGFNIVGAGGFFHYRIQNVLFLGTEIEFLNSPIQYNIASPQKQWIPVVFLGGGFSKVFDNQMRVNFGIFYDIVNDLNSPFRQAYLTKKTDPGTGLQTLIPLLYRVSLVIPLGSRSN